MSSLVSLATWMGITALSFVATRAWGGVGLELLTVVVAVGGGVVFSVRSRAPTRRTVLAIALPAALAAIPAALVASDRAGPSAAWTVAASSSLWASLGTAARFLSRMGARAELELLLLEGLPGRSVARSLAWSASKLWWYPTITWASVSALHAMPPGSTEIFGPESGSRVALAVVAAVGATLSVVARWVQVYWLAHDALRRDRVDGPPPASRRRSFEAKVMIAPPPEGPLAFERRPDVGPCTFGTEGE